MGRAMEKAVRLGNEEKNFFNDWNELVYYFPEIKIIRKSGEILDVHFPKEAFNKSFVKMNNQVYTLGFEIERKAEEISEGMSRTRRIQYESPLATKSILMDLVRG